MENNPFDTVGGNENTGNTEDRTIMMNSLKDFHTGEDEQSEPSYDSEPENDNASGDNDNAEDSDEVTEEEYQEYLKVYKNGDKTETNGERGLKRKISALRSFYAYYYKHEFLYQAEE